MVATWSVAAGGAYYHQQTHYYLGGIEPPGRWYAPAGDLGLIDAQEVEPVLFERLLRGIDSSGKSLLTRKGGKLERSAAFDFTFSAPRSVSLLWAFSDGATKQLIESAQEKAVRAALGVLEREATFARRGKNGATIEKVALSSAVFRHGESRPAEHADGRIFGDPNLHHHAVCLSLSTRPSDGTVGGLHSVVGRNSKMLVGIAYHIALANELGRLGFSIEATGRNGLFDVKGIPKSAIRYFSARNAEIEDELQKLGTTSSASVALASATAKRTRRAKNELDVDQREQVWAEAAESNGIELHGLAESLRGPQIDRETAERLLAERLGELPRKITEHESVVDRRELLRCVCEALLGTGLPIERATSELGRLLSDGSFVEIGRDALLLPQYSTPEMIKIEREIVAMAQKLSAQTGWAVESEKVSARCAAAGLSNEQIAAVLAATGSSAIGLIEGAPGSGKSTLLRQVVEAYTERGEVGAGEGAHVASGAVYGAATSWRVSRALQDDLGIESRSIASWVQMLKSGVQPFKNGSVLIIDEAALLSSRDTHILLEHILGATDGDDGSRNWGRNVPRPRGCKVLLVGDPGQLQPISAGAGFNLIKKFFAASRVDAIVRQYDAWARQAITDFGRGHSERALEAFANHHRLVETSGSKSTIQAVVDLADQHASASRDRACLILAKTNMEVTAISGEVRRRRKAEGVIYGEEVRIAAATPSGRPIELAVAAGDRIKFLVRNKILGTINGTLATVVKIDAPNGQNSDIRIEADIAGRRVVFDPAVVADFNGRARIGWAYASTIASAQGMTVDRAVALVSPAWNRHDALVASSRARSITMLVINNEIIDHGLRAEASIDRQGNDAQFSNEERRQWLASRISRASPKISTLDVIDGSSRAYDGPTLEPSRSPDFDYER